jgi:hypothetical protein
MFKGKFTPLLDSILEAGQSLNTGEFSVNHTNSLICRVSNKSHRFRFVLEREYFERIMVGIFFLLASATFYFYRANITIIDDDALTTAARFKSRSRSLGGMLFIV